MRWILQLGRVWTGHWLRYFIWKRLQVFRRMLNGSMVIAICVKQGLPAREEGKKECELQAEDLVFRKKPLDAPESLVDTTYFHLPTHSFDHHRSCVAIFPKHCSRLDKRENDRLRKPQRVSLLYPRLGTTHSGQSTNAEDF
jgi:hypothetical protein